MLNHDTNITARQINFNAGNNTRITTGQATYEESHFNITAQQVDINTATDTYANQQTMKYKQSGVTVGVSNPIISAAQTVNQMKEAASQTKNGRMQSLAAGTSALAIKNAADSVIAGNTKPQLDQHGLEVLDANGKNSTENPIDQVGGISLNISIGTSKSKSNTSQTAHTAKASTLNAGGDINIVAHGAGKNSGINVIGSQLKAADDITLTAQDEINLIAAKNTNQHNSNNKSSSASLGVSVNMGAAGGVGVTAGLSKGKGKSNSQDTTWSETKIQGGSSAGDSVTLNSGSDTNLIGTQARGNQIIANVGTSGKGNLNIQSLQDTSQYTSKQKNNGINVTVPVTGTGFGGSLSSSKTNIKSDYASVNEQSGVFAGDEGFQITTQGNTNLKGAVIASTDKAIQDNKNSLITQTLTTSNIENKAAYEAKATSATVGYGTQGGLPQLSGAGIGQDEGKAESTTVSAVSVGTINITDNTSQKTLTGKDSQLAVAILDRDVKVNAQGEAVNSQGESTANTIKPIFDAEKVAKEINAQVQITQAFGQQAGQAVASYVRAQRTALLTQYKSATTDAEKLQIKAQMDEVTREERVMNILIGAVSGLGGTAVTKEGLSMTADHLRDLMIEDSKKFPGVTDGVTVLTNTSGDSEGVRGDGTKVGGTRIDLDKLCGPDNKRCATNDDGSLKLDEVGRVQWNIKGADGLSLAAFLETDKGKEAAGATGGIQGWKGTLFGIPYAAGSWPDKLIESFGGTHDFVGGTLSGLYDEQGNATRGRSEELQKLQDAWSASGAIVVSTPFAMAEFLEPQVWQAISVLLKGAK